MALVTVFRDPYVRSWPERKPLRQQDRGYVLELGDALERPYTTDAHFACYAAKNRLNRAALDQGEPVGMMAIAFDIDAPGHEVTLPWRIATRERVRALAADHPDPYYYETRGGCRIVYQLPEPEILRSDEDAVVWTRTYIVTAVHLSHRYGLDADIACADWQRLYRLPRVVRERGAGRENFPIWGNPDKIGVLNLADVPDVQRDYAAACAEHHTFAARRRYDFPAFRSGGEGLFFSMLKARGDVIGEQHTGWIIRCPNEHRHTVGSTGDGSTILYPPAPGKTLGAICCLHNNCRGLSPNEWLMLFSAAEREQHDHQSQRPDRQGMG